MVFFAGVDRGGELDGAAVAAGHGRERRSCRGAAGGVLSLLLVLPLSVPVLIPSGPPQPPRRLTA